MQENYEDDALQRTGAPLGNRTVWIICRRLLHVTRRFRQRWPSLVISGKHMIATHRTLQWSETEPATELLSGEHLERLDDKLAATARPDFPLSVRLQLHGCEVDVQTHS